MAAMTPLAAAVLEEVGYLQRGGAPSEGLMLPTAEHLSAGDGTRIAPLMSEERGGLAADAVFKVGTAPVIVFKSTSEIGEAELNWHRLAWNFGVAPLLWVTTPRYVRIYNAYQPPASFGQVSPILGEFPLTDGHDSVLSKLADVCGRRHVAMGGFWRSSFARRINRRMRIDNVLLNELTALLRDLVGRGVRPSLAQKLVGRCIFFQYLVHRGYVAESELETRFGGGALHAILGDLDSAYRLFRWIRTTFNGDLFPIEDEISEREQLGDSAEKLEPLSDFFGHFNVSDRQGRLFPFRFDAIPVELISSIYEKFLHMSAMEGEPRIGVHFTPINLVDLVLDPVFEDLPPTAKVLDPACGSGVFLVESLRRLVWLRSQVEELNREMVRETLMRQLRGVDISQAALSVAAFSLYLALLELDPSPPRGIEALDCLKFEPLMNRVLFPTSTFDPSLADKFSQGGLQGKPHFDAIVGNPPWTHDAEAKSADRAALRRERELGDKAQPQEHFERRSGVTYARLADVPLPPRSNDWAFLWRCRDFAHSESHIALVMKSTPFFSLERGAEERRNRLLRAFPNVSLVNLAQLRLSRLFEEHQAENGESKATAGPALLFFSNCLPVDPGTATMINLPWTPTFQSTGIFELPADPAKAVALDALERRPELLKVATYGEERDLWLLERLARNRRVIQLGSYITERRLAAGQGYQPGTRYSAEHLKGLPQLSARLFRPLRVASELPTFTDSRAYRAYSRDRYEGPLVLFPEGGLTAALERGRYTAAFDPRTIVYNESFFGLSFANDSVETAQALTAVMNSSFVAYQLAFTGCTLGVKQTKVEGVDLAGLWVPRFESLSPTIFRKLVDLEAKLEKGGDLGPALKELDGVVCDACGLGDAERAILGDAVRRARAIMFETADDRASLDAAPLSSEVIAYAGHLCSALNEYADDEGDLAIVPHSFASAANDIVVMRYALTRKRTASDREPIQAALEEVAPYDISAAFGGPELPYLKPLRSLRLYVGDTLIIAKPARYRCFTPAAAWSDGDRVLADLMHSSDRSTFDGAAA